MLAAPCAPTPTYALTRHSGDQPEGCSATAQLDRTGAYLAAPTWSWRASTRSCARSTPPARARRSTPLIAGDVELLVIASFSALGAYLQTLARRLGLIGGAGQLVCVDEGLDSRRAPHRLALNTPLTVARVDGRFREPAPWS